MSVTLEVNLLYLYCSVSIITRYLTSRWPFVCTAESMDVLHDNSNPTKHFAQTPPLANEPALQNQKAASSAPLA